MTPDSSSPNRPKEVFMKWLELSDPDDRNRFLKDIFQESPELQVDVEGLIDAFEGTGLFMDRVPHATLSQVTNEFSISEGAGETIDNYKLLQQIGEGGFGVVYMAEQSQPVRRKVALKIIKPGMDTKDVIARFEAERQALALMDHPNIARVFDAGTTQAGRPYFVMELVKGVSLVEFCNANQLSATERLELFVSVCRAVQHAHHRGVIHRDLKPSNILVTLHDNKPVPKVIDFGVSKAIAQQLTEKTMFTAYGQMVGTPIYMSPEQAQLSGLDVDTRSDIYSLGVILFELLTGTTPITAEELRKSGYARMQQLIQEYDTPRPSYRLSTTGGEAQAKIVKERATDYKRLNSLLRGDLDWIVMKSLEKDRNRRYDSANGFAEDIERFLANDAIEARPPSFSYRLRKTFLKHRAVFTSAALVFITLIFGVIATSWQAYRATNATERAERALDDSVKQRKKAFRESERAIAARKETEQAFRREENLRQISNVANYAGQIRLADPIHSRVSDSEAKEILDSTDSNLRSWEYRRLRSIWGARRGLFPADDHVRCVAISADGNLVAAGGDGGSVCLFEFESRQLVTEFKTDDRSIMTLRFNADGNKLLAGTDAAVHLWDLQARKEIGSVRFPPHDRRPLTEVINQAGFNGKDPKSTWGLLPRQFPLLALNPDETEIAVAVPGSIQIWKSDLSEKVSEFSTKAETGKQLLVVGLDFFSEGKRLAVKKRIFDTKGPQNAVLLEYLTLDAATGKKIATSGEIKQLGFFNFSGVLKIVQSGNWIATEELGFLNRALTIRDARSFERISQIQPGESSVDLIRFSGDGFRFGLTSRSKVSIRYFGSGDPIAALSPPFQVNGGICHISDLAMSENGQRVVATYCRPIRPDLNSDKSIDYPEAIVGWDLGKQTAIRDFAKTILPGFSRDKYLGLDVIKAPAGVDWFAHQICKRPDGPDKADLEPSNKKEKSWVVIRSSRDGQILSKLAQSNSTSLMRLSFSRDGKVMALLQNDSVQLWDVPNRTQLPKLTHGFERISEAQIDPTGRHLFLQGTASDQSFSGIGDSGIWNIEDGKRLEESIIELPELIGEPKVEVRFLAFGPRGRRFVRLLQRPPQAKTDSKQDWTSRLEVIETATGKVVSQLQQSENRIRSAVFISNGQALCFIASKTDRGPGALWHWKMGDEKATQFHDGGGNGLQVSSEGNRLLLSERDPGRIFSTTLSLFDTATKQLVYQKLFDHSTTFVMTGNGEIISFPVQGSDQLLRTDLGETHDAK